MSPCFFAHTPSFWRFIIYFSKFLLTFSQIYDIIKPNKPKGGTEMYISYDNLWKTLIDKGIGKTELGELAGLSSRTIAKLSKNETVTTETLLRLCEVLGCGLDGIMEVRDGEICLTFAECFERYAEKIGEDEQCETYRLEYNGQVYVIKKTLKKAGKRTEINCGADIIWKQIYPVSHLAPAIETAVITKPNFAEKGERGIVLISGKPLVITGLDDGHIVSSRGKVKSDDDIYVMSSAAFKLFEP